jgi:tripartite-type tricarboxylate transporter receptor subunit TctC
MMNMRCTLIALLLTLWTGIVLAQAYPSRPIRLINPLGTGGTAEVLARTIAKQLSEQLGQPVIVETKTGATGTIGADFVAKSPADGYTLLYGVTGTNSIAPSLYRKLPYDPEKDLAPVSILFSGPNVLLAHTSLNVGSVQDLIALARTKPGALSFASAGNGSMSHLNAELLKLQAGVDLLHVPYKGGGAAAADLMSGQVSLMIETGGGVMQLVRSGKLRALAVTTPQRSAQLPEVPTFAEAGFPGMTSVVWGGLFAPGGTPRPILDRLAEECAKAARNPAYRDLVATLNNNAVSSGPDDFRAFVQNEIVRYREAVQKSGMKID